MKERVIGEGVFMDRVETNNRCDGGERADKKDTKKRNLLSCRAVDANESLDRETEDEDIG